MFWIMGWKYQAGLGLISTFVIIWVTSAEVTQVRLCFKYSPCFFLSFFLFNFGYLFSVLLPRRGRKKKGQLNLCVLVNEMEENSTS